MDLGLVFVATAGPSASDTLKLLACGAHVGFGVPVQGSRGLAEMPGYILALARTREQDTATARRGVQGPLVEGEDLAPGFEVVAPGTAAHTKCMHLQFGALLYTHLIGYSPYNHSSFAFLARNLHLDHLERANWCDS